MVDLSEKQFFIIIWKFLLLHVFNVTGTLLLAIGLVKLNASILIFLLPYKRNFYSYILIDYRIVKLSAFLYY